MVLNPTAVLVVRCAESGKLVGRVYEHADGSHEFVALRIQVASAGAAGEGWFDQTNLRGEAYKPSGEGEISVNLSATGSMANASFSAGCGCRQRVQIVPSTLRRAIAAGDSELRLAHVSR